LSEEIWINQIEIRAKKVEEIFDKSVHADERRSEDID
jgi:hypothetical protein